MFTSAAYCTTVDDGILFAIIEGVLRGQNMADPVLIVRQLTE